MSIQRSLRDTGRRPDVQGAQKTSTAGFYGLGDLSPNIPVFRADDGTAVQNFWLLSVITCAAPYAPVIGQPRSGDLLKKRIHRVLAIARSYGYNALVLGAWGCGAFHNDPHRTVADFRDALANDFSGAFSDIVFAITDWSQERRFLGPFREAFAVNVHT